MTRTLRSIAVALMALTALASCHETEGDADLPKEATDFISKYFPLSYVSSKEELPSGSFEVKMTRGATLIFDSEGSWTDLQGNGDVLPPMIAFDYFPSPLYDYIESKEQVDAIYSVSRTELIYDVLLFDTRLTYDIQTAKVTEVQP